MINILYDNEKILKVGVAKYTPTGMQEVLQIKKSEWKGWRKSEIKLINGKITEKTIEEINGEAQVVIAAELKEQKLQLSMRIGAGKKISEDMSVEEQKLAELMEVQK